MKKMLAVCLVLALVVPVALAESVDLSSMSVDELIALKASIVGELMSRGEIKEAKVPSGSYIIGEDIPAGSYTITTDSIFAFININDSNGKYINMMTFSADDPIGKINLLDGQQIELTGGTCVFSVYSGISFE